jgi:phage terminase small subunit
MAKKGELTPKQSKWVAEYAKNGGNATQAALKAYDTDDYNTAHAIGSENLQKPTIRQQALAALERNGVTLDKLSRVVADALDAEVDGKPKHDVRLNAARTATTLYRLGEKENNVEINVGEVKGLEISFKHYEEDK